MVLTQLRLNLIQNLHHHGSKSELFHYKSYVSITQTLNHLRSLQASCCEKELIDILVVSQKQQNHYSHNTHLSFAKVSCQ